MVSPKSLGPPGLSCPCGAMLWEGEQPPKASLAGLLEASILISLDTSLLSTMEALVQGHRGFTEQVQQTSHFKPPVPAEERVLGRPCPCSR